MDLNSAGDLYEDLFIKNRMLNVQNTKSMAFAKLREIFRYTGSPLTLPKRVLEGYLLKNGAAVVYEHEGDLFVTSELPSTKDNVYGDSMEIVFHHGIGAGKEILVRTIGVDAVLVRNDDEMLGLDYLVTKYALFVAQGDITFLDSFVNIRSPFHLQAKDENTFRSAEEYVRQRRAGETSVILAEEFSDMEGLLVHSTPTANNQATQAIELYQYIQSTFYSEFGINVNNNMKREYVSNEEISKSSGMPLIYNMLSCRLEAARDIKALFGVEIEICVSDEWDDEMEENHGEEQTLGSEGGVDEGAAPGDDGDGVAEEGEADEQAVEEEPEPEPEPEPEAEEVTREELIDATEAMLDEEVEHDEEAGSDPDPDDAPAEADAREDEEERPGVEPEEDDDED